MQTVKIMIEVEVPEWYNFVAVGLNGAVMGFAKKPKELGNLAYVISMPSDSGPLRVVNWRDTLTEIKNETR